MSKSYHYVDTRRREKNSPVKLACWNQNGVTNCGDSDCGSNQGESAIQFWQRMMKRYGKPDFLMDLEESGVKECQHELRKYAVWAPLCGNAHGIFVGYADPADNTRALGWAFVPKHEIIHMPGVNVFNWRDKAKMMISQEVERHCRLVSCSDH